VAGWEAIVYKSDGDTSDSPLPLALSHIVGSNNVLYHLLITIGLFGLIASFHGIILAAGRASFEFGRVRFAPAFLKEHSSQVSNTGQCVAGKYGDRDHRPAYRQNVRDHYDLGIWCTDIIYCIHDRIVATEKKGAKLERPFKVPMYPIFPVVALIIAIVFICGDDHL
jgi:ethanolamine permease